MQADQRPWWLRVINRMLTWLLNTALWLLLWLTMFMVLFFGLLALRDAAWLRVLEAPWREPLELFMRGLLAVPFGFWLLLLIRPVRTRWWFVRQAGRAWRWLSSGLHRLLRVAGNKRALAHEEQLTSPAVASPAEQREADQAALNGAATPTPIKLITLKPTLPPRMLSRRRFMLESAVFGGIIAYSTLLEPEHIQTLQVEVPIADLPSRFEGLRIAQVSDLHVNAYTTGADIAEVVRVINQLEPDVVLLTGDFVDWHFKYADEATRPFRELRVRDGVYSVLGNHDYYAGDIEVVKTALRRYDLGLLVNQHTVLQRGPDRLSLIGLDDPRHRRGGGRYSYESIDPDRAMRGVSATVPRLLMVHNPVIVPELVRRYELDLLFCGHTHGGQFQVPIITDNLIKAREYFVHGHYKLGRSQLYVNRGIGFTGPAVRFRAAPEVTLLRLTAA